ncbi:Mu transposase C-terminal domain-containing protein [Paracoccus sp. MC1854]|nr:Mu transposase C-terminal domain-containing protein [Paracoccus sp. MC1854]
MTADDLCAAIIRWVVDIYHRSAHSGLGGETPANCWRRLIEQFGVCPAPDLRRRRLALGTRFKRTVSKTGVTVFGIRYHSEELARWMLRTKKREVNLRWYREDLGAIAVELDGEWYEVPAVFDRFKGVWAQTWLAAARELQIRFKHEVTFDEEIVFKAIRHIDEINGQAMKRIGLLADEWSEARILQEEERLLIGFDMSERSLPLASPDTRFGDEMAGGAGDDIGSDEVTTSREKKKPRNARGFVSAPTASTADPLGDAAPKGDADDDPGFEIEDKW